MRVMVLVKANADSEAGKMPDAGILKEMGDFNDALIRAGVMLSGEGIQPSAAGKRVRYDGAQRAVIDGPFAETKELVAGFWIWKVKSMDEALEWARRAPFREGEIELRPVFETEDFGDAMTPELRAQEDRQRAELERRAKAGKS
jgi:hypothetical protein